MVTLGQSYTQKALEKVLQSRLVETFITVTVPSSFEESGPPAKHPHPPPSPPVPHARQLSSNASPASKRGLHSPHNSPSKTPSSSRGDRSAKRVSRAGTATSTDTSASTLSNRRVATSPAKLNGNVSKAAQLASRANPDSRTVPNFISAIHRPSINPDFALDLNDFSKWADPLATHITVQLWAKLHSDTIGVVSNDKGKEKMSDEVDTTHPQWKMAGNWNICLSDLVPLLDEVSSP
jgi:UV radiation resistance-associated gene protein